MHNLVCLKKCSIEILNDEQNSGKTLLGCLPTRITVRLRKFFSCVKKQKNKNRQATSTKLADGTGRLHNAQASS